MMNKEVRHLQEAIEIRDLEEDDSMVIEGYALKFNTWSENLGGFIETIDKRALNDTSLEDVRALIDHNSAMVIGRSSNDSLNLTVDDTGLKFNLTLPNTTYARDLYENVRVGNVDNCSFGFSIAKDGDEISFDEEKNIRKRTIRNIDQLVEVSIVSFPAYKDTDVSVAKRSIEAVQEHEQRNQDDLDLMTIELDLIKLNHDL